MHVPLPGGDLRVGHRAADITHTSGWLLGLLGYGRDLGTPQAGMRNGHDIVAKGELSAGIA
jgi:hypothetical protein